MPHIILASHSPRRRQLLEQAGLHDFSVLVPEVDEAYDPSLPPAEIVAALSRRKAEAAARLAGPGALVIAADTMVFLDGLRLGKPNGEEEAFSMLSALSGRTHQVRTGVTVCMDGHTDTQVQTTGVTFRTLTPPEIRRYIRTGEPMDKAGAYGIQGRAALFVTGICGDYCNVVGLPLCLLGRMLAAAGQAGLFAGEAET
ncbi:MAG: Maf family protein [Oscillospiraceae bacterium]|nr:Maf family protein [Oscillospiraceae bacterium]